PHPFALGQSALPAPLQLQRARAFMTWTAVRAGARGREIVRGYRGTPSAAGKADSADRRNWIPPFIMSRHNPEVLYVGTNHLIEVPDIRNSEDSTFRVISPDLTTGDTLKMRSDRTWRIRDDGLDHTEAESYCTISALAESPLQPGMLFAGTDDGNVWLTSDEGITWENLIARQPHVAVIGAGEQ